MDPTAAPGEHGQITEQDIRLYDAIGYDRGGAENRGTPACQDGEVALVDAGIVETRFDPETGASVDALQVDLLVEHSWVGDLEISLTAPDGTSAVLIDRPGRGTSGFGCDQADIDARLADGAAAAAEAACASGPALRGTLSPAEPLTVFAGKTLSGDWTLTVRDHATQDTGRLLSWCLSPSEAFRTAADSN